MAFLFAKPLSPAEQLKKHKREIDRAIRDLERERTKLQMQEKKIIAEIRKAAAQNQQVCCPCAVPSRLVESMSCTRPPPPRASFSPSRCLTGRVRPDLRPQAAAKIMAKDLVRTRRHITKFYQMKTHLQGVSLKLQTLKSNQAMADAMKGATRVQIPRHLSRFPLVACLADALRVPMPGDAVDERTDEHAAAAANHAAVRNAERAAGAKARDDGGRDG